MRKMIIMETDETPIMMIDEEDRTNFVAGANESLNSGRYPKLQLSVYFDSEDSQTGQNCRAPPLTPQATPGSRLTRRRAAGAAVIGNATYRQGNPPNQTGVTYTPMVHEGGPSNEPLFNAYRAFVASDFFAQNDVRRAPSPTPDPPAPPRDA